MKMNEKLYEVLNKQVTSEHEATLVYTQLSYHMRDLSFDGMAAWLARQADEEREHAERIAQHLLARGHRVELQPMELSPLTVETPRDVFQLALGHEQKVSEEIRTIARVADETKDLESRALVNWFLDEQVGEEDTVLGILDRLALIGDDGTGLLRLDSELGGENATEH